MQHSTTFARPRVIPCEAFNKSTCDNEDCPYSHSSNSFSLSTGGRNVCILFLMSRCDGYGCRYSHSRSDLEWSDDDIQLAVHEHVQVIDAYIGRVSRNAYSFPPPLPIAMHAPGPTPWVQPVIGELYPTPSNSNTPFSPDTEQVGEESVEEIDVASLVLREPGKPIEAETVEAEGQEIDFIPEEPIEDVYEEEEFEGEETIEFPQPVVQPTSYQWNLGATEFVPSNLPIPAVIQQQYPPVDDYAEQTDEWSQAPIEKKVPEEIVVRKKEKPKSATAADIGGWFQQSDSNDGWGWDAPANNEEPCNAPVTSVAEDAGAYKESEATEPDAWSWDNPQTGIWEQGPSLEEWGTPAETLEDFAPPEPPVEPPPAAEELDDSWRKKSNNTSQPKGKKASKGENKASAKTKVAPAVQTKPLPAKEKKGPKKSNRADKPIARSRPPLVTVIETSECTPIHFKREAPPALSIPTTQPEPKLTIPLEIGCPILPLEMQAEIKKASIQVIEENKKAQSQVQVVVQPDEEIDPGVQWSKHGDKRLRLTPDRPRDFADRSRKISSTTSWVTGSGSSSRWPKVGE